MKQLLALTAALFLSIGAFAQIERPVTWAYAAKKTSATEATVFLKATIQPGWHIYSQNVKDGGPIKTSFTFAKSADYALLGKTIEPKAIKRFEKTFGMDVSYFEKEVVFTQKIKLKSPKATTVKGSLEFMTCNDQKCLPPDAVNFTVALAK
jgi:DsbC/DsbD-like thiol-disulfide interchange protein